MEHAITTGDVVHSVLAVIAILAALGFGVGIIAFLGSGWNH